MPRARLTPLGKQLTSVLANLRPASTCRAFPRTAQTHCWTSTDRATPWARARSTAINARSRGNAQLRWQSAVAVLERHETDESTDDAPEHTSERDHGIGRLAGIDGEESEAPKPERLDYLDAMQQSDVPSRSVSNAGASLLRGKQYPMHYRRSSATAQLRLEDILYRCIERQALVKDDDSTMEVSELSDEEKDLLESTGYSISAIGFWADVVMNKDLYETAVHLKALEGEESTAPIPLFILFHVLRRPYLNARTMRVLLRISFKSLGWYDSFEDAKSLDKEDVFTLFTLLLRRTRDVWPRAMPSLVDMLLRYYPPKQSDVEEDGSSGNLYAYRPTEATNGEAGPREDELSALSFRLNKAMRLFAIPTSIHPFRTIPIQENCVIRILRFLAEYDPILEVNRDGFRALILIQLAQPKSANDRLWAELKTLSWPPWKEDRTAVDIDITARKEGRSKAAETLERMREAGFAPYEWERVAGIYSGWDTDGTPTMQKRVTFSSGKRRLEAGTAAWSARIETTRTIQEAWACWLAYYDQCNEKPDQDVCQAMFRKLHEEEMRIRGPRRYLAFRLTRAKKTIWPGDAVEIEPPPPSVHQHTYTRTVPPSFHEFWKRLKESGVVFESHCLAVTVVKADSMERGLQYLAASEAIYPAIRGLTNDSSVDDISSIPDVVFAAFMELLGRFSNFSLSKHLPVEWKHLKGSFSMPYHSGTLILNADHALIHGIMLLKHRLPLYRPAWHSILRSIGRSSSHLMLNIGDDPILQTEAQIRFPVRAGVNKTGTQRAKGYKAAFTAIHLTRDLLHTMHGINIDIDAVSFLALCHTSENWARSCWLELRRQAARNEDIDHEVGHLARTLDRHQYPRFLRKNFMNLVGEGDDESGIPEDHMSKLPRLLEVPDPTILHAYIRALGWMGDFPGLLAVVRWMTEYRSELRERRSLDRNGDAMVRRAIIALRVFLERSWLLHDRQSHLADNVDGSGNPETAKIKLRYGRNNPVIALKERLHRLETPANEETVTEIEELVQSVEDWGGWPTDDEAEEYGKHDTFQQFYDT